MSFVVHFVDQVGSPSGSAVDADAAESTAALTAEEVAAWDGLHPHLLELLPAGSHDVAANPYSRQLVHEQSGLMVTWAHDDYQASLPFWSVNASDGTLDVLIRVTEAIESATGRVGVDEISQGRFLDHQAEVRSSFAAIADGFEEAMDSQTVLGWLRNLFHMR